MYAHNQTHKPTTKQITRASGYRALPLTRSSPSCEQLSRRASPGTIPARGTVVAARRQLWRCLGPAVAAGTQVVLSSAASAAPARTIPVGRAAALAGFGNNQWGIERFPDKVSAPEHLSGIQWAPV